MSKPPELKSAMRSIKPVLCTQFMCECIDQWFDEWKETQDARRFTGEAGRLESHQSGNDTATSPVLDGGRETCAA